MSLPEPAEQNLLQQTWTWLFLLTETVAGHDFDLDDRVDEPLAHRSEEADRCRDRRCMRRRSMCSSPPTTSRTISWSGPSSPRPASIIPICGCGCWMTGRGNGCESSPRNWVHITSAVSKGLHAKAGNVNNGLAHALSTGRRPQFILLLDADFTVSRNILQRTLGLFEAEDVAIVQTPQHFFNPDPIQSSLLGATAWPDEQRFFFNYLLEAKDAWAPRSVAEHPPWCACRRWRRSAAWRPRR